jgi:hypothetical protein
VREDERGKKGGEVVGDGPWVVPRGSEAWGRGANAAVERRGVVGSGPAPRLAPKQGRATLMRGPRHSNGRRV